MNAAKLLLLGAVSLVSLGTAARAADLDAPLYEMPPEVVPVEIGSGWYLRGDVSYDFKTDVDVDYRTYSYTAGPPPVAIYGAETYDAFEIKEGAAFSLGAGYQFNDMFRGDLTAHYWKHDIDGSDLRSARCDSSFALGTACRTADAGNADAWELMANAYLDLGNFAGFTPYVGGGVGAVHLEYDQIATNATCLSGGVECGPAFGGGVAHEGLDSWRFAYAAMAGVSYDLSQSLKLDVGYRYLNVDGGDVFAFDQIATTNGASGAQAIDGGFDRHTIQAGLRYSLF